MTDHTDLIERLTDKRRITPFEQYARRVMDEAATALADQAAEIARLTALPVDPSEVVEAATALIYGQWLGFKIDNFEDAIRLAVRAGMTITGRAK